MDQSPEEARSSLKWSCFRYALAAADCFQTSAHQDSTGTVCSVDIHSLWRDTLETENLISEVFRLSLQAARLDL